MKPGFLAPGLPKPSASALSRTGEQSYRRWKAAFLYNTHKAAWTLSKKCILVLIAIQYQSNTVKRCTPVIQIFPAAPTFIEKDIPDLTVKVTIVTGSTSGVGFETASILYSKNATVYIAARSSEKARQAIDSIRASPDGIHSSGQLLLLPLDLSGLCGVKSSVNLFLEKESRLNILIHNAGVMTPPAGRS